MNWPIGNGDSFRGFVDRQTKQVHLFAKGHRAGKATEEVLDLTDARLSQMMTPELYDKLREEMQLVDALYPAVNETRIAAGQQNPVYFGSAITNFGVEFLLQSFLELSCQPGAKELSNGALLPPEHPEFVGFVFKLQANLDPKHRDRMAFVRVCSGVFRRGMKVCHSRSKRYINLAQAQSLFGQVLSLQCNAWIVFFDSGRIGKVWTKRTRAISSA